MPDCCDGGNRIFRILDAAIDRGREAIRVLEDAVRFIVDDARMTEILKDFRHRFAALTNRVPIGQRLEGRATTADVGTVIEGVGEYDRESLAQILTANFCRLQEALRSVEEYSKLVFPEITHASELLRYESYTIQKEVFAACVQEILSPVYRDRMDRLSQSLLYVLIDANLSDNDFRKIIYGGADMIQLRDKTVSDRRLFEAGRRFRALLKEVKSRNDLPVIPLLIVNDRPDIAISTDADGVHIGQSEIPPMEVRRLIGSEMILGLSTSCVLEAEEALTEAEEPAHVDYLGAGPVFPSMTKSFDSFPGLDYLRALASDDFTKKNVCGLPIFAIGGITPENLGDVLATGVDRIAVASAVTGSPDTKGATKELKRLLTDYQNKGGSQNRF